MTGSLNKKSGIRGVDIKKQEYLNTRCYTLATAR